jgi:uncharacterized BrkB/YihY/UPF0761 family membrane protein
LGYHGVLGFFAFIGVMFGALAGASAYVISLNEYRQRMLRVDQNPRRMALGTAVATFLFFFVGSMALYFLLTRGR